jgi:hypothetical protein
LRRAAPWIYVAVLLALLVAPVANQRFRLLRELPLYGATEVPRLP